MDVPSWKSIGFLYLGVVIGLVIGIAGERMRPTQGTLPKIVLSSYAAVQCNYHDGGALPDPRCTPGALNPSVTQGDIASTICKSGWTSTIRPDVSVTEPQKYASIRAYGSKFGTSARAYEFDHLVPLELGGAVDDPHNMWAEPHHVTWKRKQSGSFAKDGIENHINALVCSGKMKLSTARRYFTHDWLEAR